MVVNVLLDVVKGLVDWFISIRPSWNPTIPAVTELLAFCRTLDTFIPMHEALACLVLWCSLFGVMIASKWVIKIIDWVADVIP